MPKPATVQARVHSLVYGTSGNHKMGHISEIILSTRGISDKIYFFLRLLASGVISKYYAISAYYFSNVQKMHIGVNVPAVNRHINNTLDTAELDKSVISKMEITAADGKKYQTNIYSLDAIISVGYRVNSKKATHAIVGLRSVFRKKKIILLS